MGSNAYRSTELDELKLALAIKKKFYNVFFN